MVDDFEKKYMALDIPYPKDTSQAEIAAEDAKQKMAYDKFVTQSATRADGVKEELAKVIFFPNREFLKSLKIYYMKNAERVKRVL